MRVLTDKGAEVLARSLLDWDCAPTLCSSTAAPIQGHFERAYWSVNSLMVLCRFDPWVQLGPYSTAELADPVCVIQLTDKTTMEVPVEEDILIQPMQIITIYLPLTITEVDA